MYIGSGFKQGNIQTQDSTKNEEEMVLLPGNEIKPLKGLSPFHIINPPRIGRVGRILLKAGSSGAVATVGAAAGAGVGIGIGFAAAAILGIEMGFVPLIITIPIGVLGGAALGGIFGLLVGKGIIKVTEEIKKSAWQRKIEELESELVAHFIKENIGLTCSLTQKKIIHPAQLVTIKKVGSKTERTLHKDTFFEMEDLMKAKMENSLSPLVAVGIDQKMEYGIYDSIEGRIQLLEDYCNYCLNTDGSVQLCADKQKIMKCFIEQYSALISLKVSQMIKGVSKKQNEINKAILDGDNSKNPFREPLNELKQHYNQLEEIINQITKEFSNNFNSNTVQEVGSNLLDNLDSL